MRSIVATNQLDRTGVLFTDDALRTMVNTFDKQGIPVLDNFNQNEIIGVANNPKFEDGNLSVELDMLDTFKGEGNTVIGYYQPTMQLYSIGVVDKPMDVNVGYIPKKEKYYKYEVVHKVTEIFVIPIVAKSMGEASDKAMRIVEKQGEENFFNDKEFDEDVFLLGEV